MICIFVTRKLYIIRLMLGSGESGKLYLFSRRFLNENCLRKTGLLPVAPADRVAYMLDRTQLDVIIVLLEKLCAEVSSGYFFSKDLQRTYLMQIFHLIRKSAPINQ